MKINIWFLLNPYYFFIISFSLAFLLYSWGWSALYPRLSLSLAGFFLTAFLIFGFTGRALTNFIPSKSVSIPTNSVLHDISFSIILLLGILDIILSGFIPAFHKTIDYKEFGVPVLDVLFNTLCIFFSAVFFQSFLNDRKKRLLVYIVLILIFQILIFRRSTIIWILMSSLFIYLFRRPYPKIYLLVIALLVIPFFSYLFGMFGEKRSDMDKKYMFEELKASGDFRKLKISHFHYNFYLYLSSPLANLQQNIEKDDRICKKCDLRQFFFYSIIPPSITMRLENKLGMSFPESQLIHRDLLVGTVFLASYATMGWSGMIMMLLFMILYFYFCLVLLRKYGTFNIAGFALLLTAASLLIFDNFLIRLDVIFILFLYPVVFHFIYSNRYIKLLLKSE